MNRNTESHFADLPEAEISRSMIDMSFDHKTSFDIGELIPISISEVLPGDTFQVTTSIVARLQTLLTPVMSNLYIDTFWFFVPSRLVWTHWKEFMGENTQSPWIPPTEYSLPLTSFPENGWNVGSIADYMGIPTGVYSANPKDFPQSLPFRAYAMICDQWFRDQNLTDPLSINTGDSNSVGSNGSNYITDVELGGKPFKVAKYHDYFTSCLPSPQKGPDVNIALAGAAAPVTASETNRILDSDPAAIMFGKVGSTETIRLSHSGSTVAAAGTAATFYPMNSGSDVGVYPMNLYADLSQSTMASINSLRLAFQLQKFYEKAARGGTRYREVILSQFAVHSPDARMMIPEYLGGHRFPLSIHQVANTSQDAEGFLGDLGAMSNTSDVHDDFVKSFTEHGYVLGLMCARYDHSYPQGMHKLWQRRNMLDFYFPVFANIGEQPVPKRSIYLSPDAAGTGTVNDQTFGYQEAWAEYRYMPDRVSGEMRPSAPNSLASWHLADNYSTAPSLSDAWIREDKTNVDRVLAVTSSVSNQVFADIYVKNIAVRPMPVYSIPGLIDHH